MISNFFKSPSPINIYDHTIIFEKLIDAPYNDGEFVKKMKDRINVYEGSFDTGLKYNIYHEIKS